MTPQDGRDRDPRVHQLPQPARQRQLPDPQPDASRQFPGGLSGRLQWTRGARHRGHRRRPAAGRLGPELHRPARGARRRCHRGRHRRGLLAALQPGLAELQQHEQGRQAERLGDVRPAGLGLVQHLSLPAISPATAARRTRGDRIPMPSSPTGIPPTRRPSALECHVSHGSNALMTGLQLHGNSPTPRATLHPNATSNSGDSHLLKVDGRGPASCATTRRVPSPTSGSSIPPNPAP